MITTDESKTFITSARAQVEALRQELLKEAVTQFGTRFPTVEVHGGRGKRKVVPVEDVSATFVYVDAAGLPHIHLEARVTDPWTGESRTVFLADLGRGF